MKTELQSICGFAARKSPMMIRNAVRITKDFCYASDGNSSMKTNIDGPDLDVAVDASLLSDILKTMPNDQTVTISRKGDAHVELKGGHRKLKLRVIDMIGLQEIEAGGKFHKLDAAAISAGLKYAAPATALRDVARPYFNNVIIDFTNAGTFVVGCDGYRLHAYRVDDVASEQPLTCALPLALARRMSTLCEVGGDLEINRHRAIYRKGESEFIAVLGNSEYAPWQRIVPKPDQYSCLVDVGRVQLSRVAETALKLGANHVTMTVDPQNGLDFTADLKGDELNDHLDADVNGSTRISFRPQYIVEAMDAIGGEMVKLHIPEADNFRLPMLITSGGHEHICFVMGYKP